MAEVTCFPPAGAAGEERRVFHHAQLEGLPEPVQRYFKYALQDGQKYIKFCTIKQSGKFRCVSMALLRGMMIRY